MIRSPADPTQTRSHALEIAAQALIDARLFARPVPRLSLAIPDLTEDEAYRIAASVASADGTAIIGFKLGYTSLAMREQMNINEPNYGALTDEAHTKAGGRIAFDSLIHPLVEPEFAVRIRNDLAGPGIDAERAWQSVECVMPALEIVDTRYEGYDFRQVDNIADNSSAARFVLGDAILRHALPDLRSIKVRLSWNGAEVDAGSGADVMGNPASALAWFANKLGAAGGRIAAGHIVLTGGVTRAYPAAAGDRFLARFDGLGAVDVQF